MSKPVIYIAKYALLCYIGAMNRYFENQMEYGGLTLYFGNIPTVTEREIHSYYEVMFYMGSEVLLLTESGQRRIKNNTLLIIPKETYHYFR